MPCGRLGGASVHHRSDGAGDAGRSAGPATGGRSRWDRHAHSRPSPVVPARLGRLDRGSAATLLGPAFSPTSDPCKAQHLASGRAGCSHDHCRLDGGDDDREPRRGEACLAASPPAPGRSIEPCHLIQRRRGHAFDRESAPDARESERRWSRGRRSPPLNHHVGRTRRNRAHRPHGHDRRRPATSRAGARPRPRLARRYSPSPRRSRHRARSGGRRLLVSRVAGLRLRP